MKPWPRQTAEIGLEYGALSFWTTELSAGYVKQPSDSYKLETVEWSNVLQITPQGRYWLDAGVLLNYEAAHEKDQPNSTEVGLLLEKQWRSFLADLNVVWERQSGHNAEDETEQEVAAQFTWRYSRAFEPSLAYFKSDEQARWGPMLAGAFYLPSPPYRLKHQLGLLFGLNDETPHHTLVWQLHYEF